MIRDLNQRALDACCAIVAQASDMGMRTPCAKWTLGELLAHMIAQNYGFAAAAKGEQTERQFWVPTPPGDDPVGDFIVSAAVVSVAFADSAMGDFWLPELSMRRAFPAAQAIGFMFVDNIVHGWDVGRALGIPVSFDVDLLEAVLPIAVAVPDGPNRLRENSMFQPGVDAPDGASTLDRIVALLGRDPNWPDQADA